MINKTLEFIKANKEQFMDQHNSAMSLLWTTRIFDFLREKGMPQIVAYGKDQNIMATQAAKSAGYQEALDDLIYFKEKFLTPSPDVSSVPMDFGALDIAVAKGDITKEEADVIRNTRKSSAS